MTGASPISVHVSLQIGSCVARAPATFIIPRMRLPTCTSPLGEASPSRMRGMMKVAGALVPLETVKQTPMGLCPYHAPKLLRLQRKRTLYTHMHSDTKAADRAIICYKVVAVGDIDRLP